MRRRLISAGSVLIAIAALGLVLYNATLVDRRAPAVVRVALSAPFGDDPGVGQTVTAVDVQFSEPVAQESVERRFRVQPYVAGTITWDGATAIFTPAQPLPPDTAFAISIEAGFADLAGNVAAQGLDEWAFRTVGPPVVAATEPADGTADVAVDTTVRLTFDRLMDTSAVERALRIEPAAPLRAAWSGQDLTLAFDGPLQFGTTYTVTVGTEAADTGGATLREPFATRFSTVSAGLGIQTVLPTGGVAGVSVRAPLAIVFDAPIDPGSVADALRITPPVPGETRVVAPPTDAGPRPDPSGSSPDGTVLLFVPSQPLAAHTTYTVVLDPVVRRLGGDEVAAGRTWSFTTGAPTPSAQNQIAFLSTRSGVRNVWFMNPDGSNPRQLTSELAPVTAFDVSLDGSRIAWASAGAVRVMQIDGSGEQTLTPADRFEYAPRFSPDGRNVLVARRDASGADLGYWLVPLPDVVGGEEAQVVIDGAPPLRSVDEGGEGIARDEGTPPWAGRAAFDPDGRHLLLATATGDVRIVDLRPEDGSAVPVVTRTGLEANAGGAWSASEHAFLIVARRPGETATALWAVPTSGSPQRHEPAVGSVAVSAEGLVALVVRGDGGIGHVATRPATGSQPATALTTGTDLADRWPAFGPEGRVVFARLRTDGPARSAGIWLADPVTRVITPLSTDGVYPRWLP